MRTTVLVFLLALISSCHSGKRLVRMSPLTGDVVQDRINLWPLFYKNGDEVAILWPLWDKDRAGFALRPLVTKDGDDWELLPPIAWWNKESGDWIIVPAYSLEGSSGLFPLVGFGDFNYVGPAWWSEDDEGELKAGGLFPLVTLGNRLNWVTLAWWKKNEQGELESHGFFPLYSDGKEFSNIGPLLWCYDEQGQTEFFTALFLYGHGTLKDGAVAHWAGPLWWIDEVEGRRPSYGLFPFANLHGGFHQVGPIFWGDNEAGELEYMAAVPLFGYKQTDEGGGKVISLLGGRGWDATGKTQFLNVLGPVYHHTQDEHSQSTQLLWPFMNWSENQRESSWHLWPLAGQTQHKASESSAASSNSWALLGLVDMNRSEGLESLRIAPLFSYISEDGGRSDLADFFTLFGYHRSSSERRSMHLGTPLVFNYVEHARGYRWSALLGMLDYEQNEDESSFDILYYLYRQQTSEGQTRRNLFPFITWDNGTAGTGFSFMWHLIHYESDGERRGGHFLFIPWGDLD